MANVLLILLLAPLFDGAARKLKAFIQSRQGPPLLQPYLDLMKLFAKEDLQPGGGLLFRAAPVVGLAALLVAAMLIPLGGAPPLGGYGDSIVWVYVMSLAAVAVMVGAFASGNPYAYAGAGRETMMMLTVEPIVVTALAAGFVKSKTLLLGGMMDWQLGHGMTASMAVAGIAFLLALQANMSRLPFDMVEAEGEVVDGPLIEYSGPRLALLKLSLCIRQLIYAAVFVSVFVPWPRVEPAAVSLVLTLAKALGVLLATGVVDSIMPRLRIDQSMTFMSRILLVALSGLALALMGA